MVEAPSRIRNREVFGYDGDSLACRARISDVDLRTLVYGHHLARCARISDVDLRTLVYGHHLARCACVGEAYLDDRYCIRAGACVAYRRVLLRAEVVVV